MNSKLWIKTYLIFIASIISIIFTVNYLIDPFDIFGTKILKQQNQLNERFVKIEYLKKNHHKFNSYIFGSSRVGVTNPKIIENYIKGSKFYNFTLSQANLYDYVIHLEYFIRNNYTVNNLYLQIDPYTMRLYGHDKSNYMNKIHPDVIGSSKSKFYLEYLSGYFPQNIKGKLSVNFLQEQESDLNYNIKLGMWSKPVSDKKIAMNSKLYIKNEKTFHEKTSRYNGEACLDKTIKDLEKIVVLSKKNHINLYLFITPINKILMNKIKIDSYFNFLRKIVTISDFYNFSAYSSVTNNHSNYYEAGHYLPHVSEYIAARIFNNNPIKDFGFFVTSKNIDNYISKLKEEIVLHDSN